MIYGRCGRSELGSGAEQRVRLVGGGRGPAPSGPGKSWREGRWGEGRTGKSSSLARWGRSSAGAAWQRPRISSNSR